MSAIQVEYHVLLDPQPLLDYARSRGLALIAALPKDRRMVRPDFAPEWDA